MNLVRPEAELELGNIESGAEHSPLYSDNSRSWSWNQFGNEVNSFGDSSNELSGLVEDKEIAARAVAFVVNSTRKGIVPLCADVANLMRSKQCLERKLYLLRKENEVFRSSASAGSAPSHSMSPIPLSVSSYTESCMKALQEQTLGVQDRYRSSSRFSNTSSTYSYSPKMDKPHDRYRSSSRCSNSSSTYSYSPKMDKPRGGGGRLCGVHYSPVTSHENRKHSSPRSLSMKDSHQRAFFPASTEQLRILNEVTVPLCTNSTQPDKDAVPDKNCLSVTSVEPIHETGNNNTDDSKDIEQPECEKVADRTVCAKMDECVIPVIAKVHPEKEETELTQVYTVIDETTNNGDVITSEQENDDQVSELKRVGDKEQGDLQPGQQDKMTKSLLERRRVSLPEMTTVPNLQALKIKPKQSKHVQCSLTHNGTSLDQALEEQFVKSVKMNAKLEEELCEAKKEIDQLKKRLKRLESGGAIPKTYTGYQDEEKVTEDNGYYTGSNRTSRNSSEHERSSVTKKCLPRRAAVTPVTYGGPLPSCRCSSCQEALGSDDDLSHYSDVYLDEPHRYAVNSKLQVQVDDHVITKSNIAGVIRYIGHLDKNDLPNTLFVGLDLDEPVGSHDGCYMDKRYFHCKRNHGVFLPLHDVISKGGKKAQVRSTKDENARIRKHLKKLTSKEEKFTHL